MKIELPLGDIVDRYSILSIKKERIVQEKAQENICTEHQSIQTTWKKSPHPPMEELQDWEELLKTNKGLWDVEEEIVRRWDIADV